MRIRRPTHEFLGINLIPMIDTMMFLLIFFLMATRFADVERDVRVKPPGSRNARPITALPQELVVNVAQDGNVTVGGNTFSLENLDGLLARAVAQNPRQIVVVRGDKRTVLQYAVNVLDLCEKHGVDKTFLTTVKTGP